MLRKPSICATVLVTLLSAAQARAQAAQGQGLASLIPNLYGTRGLIVDSEALLPDGSTHSAHFNSAFQAEFTQFNVALASQLAALNLPSPGSGFTYSFDPSLGVFTRSTQSFGPIVSDRAETIGRKKFTFGFNYQRFTFDTIEGLDLRRIPAVFTHDDFERGGGRSDVVTTLNSIRVAVNQYNAFFTYGLADRLDVSVAVPIVNVDLRVTSDATIRRIGTVDPKTHFFREDGGVGSSRSFTAAGSASGIGDLLLRLKGTTPKLGATSLALSLDVRAPTGDENDLLGAGAWGFKPTLALSWAAGKLSPHVDVGYQWNGKSLLGGNVLRGETGRLPGQLSYVAGLDLGLTDKLTLALDFLGQRVERSPRVVPTTFTAANGTTFPQIAFERSAFATSSGAAGAKWNPVGKLLLDANVIFKLDDAGLRDKVTLLGGFEYSF